MSSSSHPDWFMRAWDSAREVEELRRTAGDSAVSAHRLAQALLLRLAPCQWNSGRLDDSLASLREAIDIWRRLAGADFARFGSHLARALKTLGEVLSMDEEATLKESAGAFREAAEVWRTWTAENEHPAGPFERVVALLYLSRELRVHGSRHTLAERADVDQEIAEVFRILADDEPWGFEGSLAIALTNSSVGLWETGRRDEARDAQQEAVDIWRAITQGDDTHAARLRGAHAGLAGLDSGRLPEIENPLEWSRDRVFFLDGWDDIR